LNESEVKDLKNYLNKNNLLDNEHLKNLDNVKSKLNNLGNQEKSDFNKLFNKDNWAAEDKQRLTNSANLTYNEFKTIQELKNVDNLLKNVENISDETFDAIKRMDTLNKTETDKLLKNLEYSGAINNTNAQNNQTLQRKLNYLKNLAGPLGRGGRGKKNKNSEFARLSENQKRLLRRLDNLNRLTNKRNKNSGNLNSGLNAMYKTSQYYFDEKQFYKNVHYAFTHSTAVIDELIKLKSFFIEQSKASLIKDKILRIQKDNIPTEFEELVEEYFKALSAE